MKWLIQGLFAIFVLLFLTAFGLWLAGLRPARGSFEVSILIHQPREKVYAALLNPEITKKWISGIAEIRQDPPGTPRVGTKFLITEDFSGQWIEMEEKITYLAPPSLVKYQVESVHHSELGEYQLEEEDGGTRFSMKSQMEFHGTLYRLLEPLITPFIRNKLSNDQRSLKEILEN